MAIEVEKPSRVTQIPVAPGIKLENLIQFDSDCIDPVALVIIIESLDYALETSARRLESLGKIFSGVEESAYTSGHGILPTIKAIRDAFLQAPQCTPTGPKIMAPQPSPEAAIVAEARRRTEEQAKPPKAIQAAPKTEPKPAKKTEIEAMLETLPKEVRQAAETEYKRLKEAAKPEVKLEKARRVKPKAEAADIEEIRKAAEVLGLRIAGELRQPRIRELSERAWERIEEKKHKLEKKERELPGLWGKAFFKGEGKEAALTGEYESPGALAEALGISTRGAKDTPTAFRRAGFEVRGDGEAVEKGKTGFIVKRVGPTPRKYRRVEEAPELIVPGRAVLPAPTAERVPEIGAKYPQPWSKTITGWIDAEGKEVPPEEVRKAFRREE